MSATVSQNLSGNWSAACLRCRPAWASGYVTTREMAEKVAAAHNRQKHSGTPAKPAAGPTSARPAGRAASNAQAEPCRICGSTAVVWKKTNKLAKTMFFTPALLLKRKPHCAQCGAVRSA